MFSLLMRCDGQQEVPESDQLSSLVQAGVVRPATDGERLTPWQEHRSYDNRYIPTLYLSITGKCNFM